MSQERNPTSITILDKEYTVSCAPDEQVALHQAVSYLNDKMRELKDSGKVIGTESIAVMAALNVVHELLEAREQNQHLNSEIDEGLRRLNEKISFALHAAKPAEAQA